MNPKLLQSIMEKKILDDGLQAEIKRTILDFKQTFITERQLAAKA